MKNLYLIRGVSGAGKTTLAQSLCISNLFDKHIEVDQYFTDREGNHNFDITKLQDAHNYCYQETIKAMQEGYHKVVISNTLTRDEDLEPYYKLAEYFKYKVFCLVVENRHGNNDVHGVPERLKTQMKKNLKNSIKI